MLECPPKRVKLIQSGEIVACKRRRPHARGGEPHPATHGKRCDVVVPTRVGVNRPLRPGNQDPDCRPHARGGEPELRDAVFRYYGVVPTRVGVNRWWRI